MAHKSPALNFYTADYYIGTRVLSQAERGAYMDLICMFHQHGHLTYEQVIMFCEGKVYPNVLAKLDIDDKGLYYHKKADQVIREKSEFIENRVKNFGKYAGKSKAEIAKMKAEDDRLKAEKAENEAAEAPLTQREEKIPKPKSRQPVILKPPTLEEVEKYFIEHEFPVSLAKRAWEGYQENNWIDSQGKEIKNWKLKMQQVWFKDEQKVKTGIVDVGQHPGQVFYDSTKPASYKK
jgi:hypothetical protein